MSEFQLEERRRYLQASPTKGILLDNLIPESVAAEMREGVRPLLEPYYLADRGRYEVDETYQRNDVVYGLVALASETAQLAFRLARTRWTRHTRGDYALFKNDSRLWRGMDRHFEMVLDFSAVASAEGHIFWTREADAFWMPQKPCAGVLIDRRQAIQRYDRYLSQRFGDGEIFRLTLALEVDS